MLDEGFDRDVVGAAGGGESLVPSTSGALGQELLVPLVGLCWVLRDARLHALDSQPMRGETHLAGDLWQRRVYQLLKVHLFVFHVEQRLSRPYAGLAEFERSRAFVSVQRLHVKQAQCL